ncbi:hypothetical protein [Lewinella sp. IMCC34183]|uniref:hypothetical protein n=1 Tax=Lewinella sp. IMCC34183 TaxID=2248762 RepID=UPI000E27F189|nr:hypothetical protein [Lewinella sp. IMCC34183]
MNATINNGKATVNRTLNGLTISVPSRKVWLAMIFLPVWLCGWAFGFVAAGSNMLGLWGAAGETDLFLAVWLVGWTVGGIFAIGVVLWLWFGRETFEISGTKVHFTRGVFGLGLRKELDRSQVENVRYHAVDTGSFSGNRNAAAFGFGDGRIKFDYGMKTYSFGLGVDEAEARYLVEQIASTL